MKTDMEGDIPGWFTVYVNPEFIINILAFTDVRKRFRITVDTEKENAILVHTDSGKVMKFVEVNAGLYIWKPSYNAKISSKTISPNSFLTLVEGNKANFTKREVDQARTTGAIALYPSSNPQGSWYFMSLNTGKRIHRYQWTILPVSKDVLSRVESIAIHEGQP